MLRRCVIVICLTLTIVSQVRAQYDPYFSHYWGMEPSFNPAAVGKEEKINVAAAYAMSLVGFENNPRTLYAGADMPFRFIGAIHGVGASFMKDDIGLFSHKKFAIQYAYQHKLLGGKIAAGINIGLLSEAFDGSGVDVEESDDPALPSSEVTGTGLDLGLGLYYIHKQWYAGISVLHLNSPTIEIGETSSFDIDATYYLTGGYNIKLRNPFLQIQPSILAMTDGLDYRVDITARVKYTNEKKNLYAGLAYSPTNSFTVLIGGDFHGVSLGYSYEVYTSAISIGNGSHELFIGYQTDINLGKKGKNKHKSVRFL